MNSWLLAEVREGDFQAAWYYSIIAAAIPDIFLKACD